MHIRRQPRYNFRIYFQ